jgi:S1-C subfamily serine protease
VTRGCLILLVLVIMTAGGRGEEKIVEMFDGATTQTTGTFAVSDKWELRWHNASTLTLTVVNSTGTIVAGTTATADGSLYQPGGGTFYLQILGTPAPGARTWHVDVVELGPGTAVASTTDYVPPAIVPSPSQKPAPLVTGALTLTNAPASATTTGAAPAASSAALAPAHLTEAQTRAIVLVQGDVGQGTGFLTHDQAGAPVVITNNHVLFANPNVRITTAEGRQIPVLAYRGATDRDLMMLSIKDDHYAYLDTAKNVDQLVHEDDQVLTPGNSEGGGVFLDTSGEIRAIGPDQIEISNPIFHGNSGGPVLQVASGKVVGVVTRGEAVHARDQLDAASLANSNSAISGSMRYFAERIDTVPAWETYDLSRFLAETTFLHDFHKQSRMLDSMLNGLRYEQAHLPVTTGDEGYLPSSRVFLNDPHLRALSETYNEQAHDADKSQQMDAARELYSDLADYASANMDEIKNPANFYQFDRVRAKEEISYRQHLIDELGNVGDRIGNLGH